MVHGPPPEALRDRRAHRAPAQLDQPEYWKISAIVSPGPISTIGFRSSALEPVGFAVLGQQPLGEVEPFLQLGDAGLQRVHLAQPLMQVLHLRL